MLLDTIREHEMSVLEEASTPEMAFSYFLLGVVHAKAQVVTDLCFSEYLAEAYSILRDTIECGVHACRLLAKPELLDIWLKRDDDQENLKAWREEFWFDKESRLSEGLPEIYSHWKFCSNWFSHANKHSIIERLFIDETGELALHTNTIRQDELPLMMSGIFMILSNLERRTFERTAKYLGPDETLTEMRKKLSKDEVGAYKKCGIVAPNGEVVYQGRRIQNVSPIR